MEERKFDRDVAEKGLVELMELKIYNLGIYIEGSSDIGLIKTAVNEYQMIRDVAKSIGMDTQYYDDIFISKKKELKKRFGIQIK